MTDEEYIDRTIGYLLEAEGSISNARGINHTQWISDKLWVIEQNIEQLRYELEKIGEIE